MAISSLEALQECGRRSKNYVGGLVSETAQKAAAAIIENQPDYGNVEISANSWQTDNTANYPAFYDISVSGITTNHRADVIFPLADLEIANACGVSAFTETSTDKVRIRAKEAPTQNLTARIWITYGKEIQNAGNDE